VLLGRQKDEAAACVTVLAISLTVTTITVIVGGTQHPKTVPTSTGAQEPTCGVHLLPLTRHHSSGSSPGRQRGQDVPSVSGLSPAPGNWWAEGHQLS
jgi:hypothetical protein